MSITAREALSLVMGHARVLPSERIRMDARALGRVLAAPLFAPQPSPRWDVSAMDGFAVRSCDFPAAYSGELEILGEARAGDRPKALKKRGAIRIMTGAMIPRGADAVLPREQARVEGRVLHVARSADVADGDHIRVAGEELNRGARVAEPGTRLSSRWIGFLNAVGVAECRAFRRPEISLLVSGSELKAAGFRLLPGQIHDSNGPMLEAALGEEGLSARATRLKDSPEVLGRALKAALGHCDLLLLSGGVSVGEADYSRAALKAMGVKTIFWGVAQKPGKPLFFGSKGKTLVFGLPGNPAAAWVCFHEYVRPALWALQGLREAEAPRFAFSAHALKRDAHKTLFLKAKLEGSKVTLLGSQQSHMLGSLAKANALAMLEPGGKGRLLELRPL